MTMLNDDLFAETSFGKVALRKLAPVSENFRLYAAGWLGSKPEEFSIMKVTGAEFRIARSGKNAGKFSILVKGTIRNAFVTAEEMNAIEEAAPERHTPLDTSVRNV